MDQGRNVTIKELVNQLVDERPKGRAVARLQQLHGKLKQELTEATHPQEQARLAADIQFLEGYQETPAAMIADLQARPLHRQGSKKVLQV